MATDKKGDNPLHNLYYAQVSCMHQCLRDTDHIVMQFATIFMLFNCYLNFGVPYDIVPCIWAKVLHVSKID